MTIPLEHPPLWRPLRDVRTVTARLVGHFAEQVAVCGALPGEAITGDVTTVTRMCLEIVGGVIDGGDVTVKMDRLAHAAAGWAHEGIPIDTILHAFHEGLRLSMDLVCERDSDADRDTLVDGFRTAMAISDQLCATVARTYIREYRAIAGQHHSSVHTLTSALLAGQPTTTMARECGIGVASAYHVVALSIQRHPDERDRRFDGGVIARRTLRRVQTALAQRCGESVLALLSVDGGTLLIPSDLADEDSLDALVAGLSQSARADILATVISAATGEIPDAAQRAHELLDIVERLECLPGLYRFDDLALEYQLTRPGPGRARLGELLAPLDAFPELYETLRVHVANNMNRRRTARLLHVHTNTVDYRMRRVAQLTGFDPIRSADLWQLRSAMIARSYQSGPSTDRANRETPRRSVPYSQIHT
ncbi:PucR family transcriptional regulator [Nocardia sp. NPDC004415]